MKTSIIIMSLVITTFSCKAQQIVPVEKWREFKEANDDEIPNGTYLKDINHLLDKYLGTWKGTYDNKNYTFVITKFKHDYLGISEDKLAIRYLITTNSGTVLEDTRSLPTTSIYVIKGEEFGKTTVNYMSNYSGKDNACGQSGVVYISNIKDTQTQIKLQLYPDNDLINLLKCPSGVANQILPVKEQMLLTKQ